ncbi:hypothetical protein D3C74_466420 [compost metagenome]
MDMPMHIHVRHMLVHVHRFMREKEEILIYKRVFTHLIKPGFQPPVPATAAVVIAKNQNFITIQGRDDIPRAFQVQEREIP